MQVARNYVILYYIKRYKKGSYKIMSRRNILSKVRENADRMKQDLDKESTTKRGSADSAYWIPPWDDSKKTGVAVIAFLPFKDLFEDDEASASPFIFVPDHTNLQTKRKKIWRTLCPGQLDGRTCPICDAFWEFYNGSDADKELAKKIGLSRKRHFMGNIMVLKNDANPEQVGQVYKWKFGITINDKIMSKLNPEEGTGEESIMIHDPEQVLPFKVKLKEKGGYRNYDDCEFLPTRKHVADYILDKDATEDAKNDWLDTIIEEKLFLIKDFVNEDDYKTNAELETITNDVLDYYGLADRSPLKSNDVKTGSEMATPDPKPAPKPETLETPVSDEADDKPPFDTDLDISEKDDFDIGSLFSE